MRHNKSQKPVVSKSRFTVNKGTETRDRDDMSDGDFAIPTSRRYPIPDEAHALNALSRVEQYGTDAEQQQVRNAVKKKFPSIGKAEKTTTNKSTLTVNEDEDDADTGTALTTNNYIEITCNLDMPKVRNEILEGRNYTVVPMVMITEGVHAGSNGPLYYPSEELSKTPAVWNHKPVVVYHPMENGSAISACDPTVISRRKVGIIMNTKYIPGKKGQPGKLKAEAWLETNRLAVVDDRVADAVKKKQVMEVSTGLFTDNEQADGIWNKKSYTAIARNYRADHLAILPDQEGACSVKDGGGLMRNAASHSEIRDTLNELIRAKHPSGGLKSNDVYVSSPWVRDVYDKFCIYNYNGKTFRHDYDVKSDVVSLKGTPVEVISKQVYKTTDGKVLNTGDTMDEQEIIDALIGNAKSPFDEDDREHLSSMSINKLQVLATNAGIKHSPGGDSIDTGDDDGGEQLKDAASQVKGKKLGSKSGATKNKGKVVKDDEAEPDKGKGKKDDDADDMSRNAAQKPLSVEEYIANAPEGMRDVLASGLQAHNAQRAKLITAITANRANVFTKQELATKPTRELHAIASLCRPVANAASAVAAPRQMVANYSGLGDTGYDQPVTNDGALEEPMEMPTLNWNKKRGSDDEDDDD